MCRGQPVLDDTPPGCVRYEGMQGPHSYNALSFSVGGDEKVARDVVALLYHVLFTLKP